MIEQWTLQQPAFYPLPLQSITPLGWLHRQLQIQADGLSGHLDEFWPDIRDSQWFGGDSEAWERAPYWLDGIIPLAFLLDDSHLKAKVTRYVSYILTHQQDDGWLGPRTMVAAAHAAAQPNYDLWGQILATKMLWVYGQAVPDPAIPEALDAAFRCIDHHIDRAPLFNWGQFRWFEALLALQARYEATSARWLAHLATKLRAQGFDWRAFFEAPAGWPAAEPTPKWRWNYMSHVVNNAMAIKAPALWWRFTGDPGDRKAAYGMLEKLMRHHGMPTGVFTGDECLAGTRPTHGTELCAVVELAFSLETLIWTLGDPVFADQLERVIFNALPATFTADMWAHQYDQQVNQVMCSARDDHIWNTNGPESNLFGLEPNYGCCTANFSQGWPKFTHHLWMRSGDRTKLVAVAYAPSRVSTRLGGQPVTVTLETEYPFSDRLHFTISTEGTSHFALWLRIPAWTNEGLAHLADGKTIMGEPGTFLILERDWSGTTEIDLTLEPTVELWRGYNGAVAIRRGPLVYALPIGTEWRRVHEDQPYRELPHADWEVYPTTAWNYALDVDETTLTSDVTFTEHQHGDDVFSPDKAPVSAVVHARRLPGWTLEGGAAADPPPSPVQSSEPIESLRLIPYGCTKLRITEFPTLKRNLRRRNAFLPSTSGGES